MRLKADWSHHLHFVRRREIEILFSRCPQDLFARGLELGAGDGFQSGLLSRYVTRLTSTDFDRSGLPKQDSDAIEYRRCDAEHLVEEFPSDQFDLVFSSNMLEHVLDVQRTLAGIFQVLRDDGVTIHWVPGPLWKIASFSLHFPNLAAMLLERITTPGARLFRGAGGGASNDHARATGNNPKTVRPERSRIQRWLWPEPHGVSAGHIEELAAFARARWSAEFQRAGFEVVTVIRGPVSSGYGFGWDRGRAALERLGIATEYAYVAVKADRASPYRAYFR